MDTEVEEKLEKSAKENGNAAVIPYAKASSGAGGFFTIYRRGQGKWTRLGTAIGSAVIIGGSAYFISNDIAANVSASGTTMLIIAGVFAAVTGILAYWAQNRPGNVMFLIDTDSEMKKVNWTSRQELIGSTRVVIGFMLIMAAMLFVVDILFGYLFWGVGVLKFSPGFFESIFKR